MRQFVVIPFAVFIFSLSSGFRAKNEPAYKNGDLIFIVNPSGQGKAIQLATKSKFTHIGIILMENDKPVFYHAVEPVSKSSLQEFIAMSADGNYEIRRLKDQSLLTATAVAAMVSEAKSKLGIHYDIGFSWSDSELYCSEFIWKLYDHTLHLHIGDLKPLKSFDLSHPAVKAKLEQRYGASIPYNENMISPGDMYISPLME